MGHENGETDLLQGKSNGTHNEQTELNVSSQNGLHINCIGLLRL